MKSLTHSLLLALALTTGAWVPVQAQTFEQSLAAAQRRDYSTAFAGLSKHAEQGHAGAQYNLGHMYRLGHGVPKNKQIAVTWYRKAAMQGHDDAQHKLGIMYDSGHGVVKDGQQAAAWYRRAADQGHADAQYDLGVSYAKGEGVARNDPMAYFWFLLASAQGIKNAAENRDIVERGLSPKQRADAQASARNWKPKTAAQSSSATEAQTPLSYADFSKNFRCPENLPTDQAREKSTQAFLTWAQQSHTDLTVRKVVELRIRLLEENHCEKTLANMRSSSARVEADMTPAPSRPAPARTEADSTGSGFRVARGAIVTNHHVIDGCSRLRVNDTAAQVRGSDARSDLALLGVDLPGPSASLRAQRAAVGEPVAVAGYPLRGLLSGFNMTTGTLSSLSGLGGDTRYLQITAPVQPGNSGGPMLDSAGNLMGVVVSKLDAIRLAKITGDMAQNVNFAINVNVLRSFLDANSVDYDSASSNKPIPPTAIAEKARGFTVLVECWK